MLSHLTFFHVLFSFFFSLLVVRLWQTSEINCDLEHRKDRRWLTFICVFCKDLNHILIFNYILFRKAFEVKNGGRKDGDKTVAICLVEISHSYQISHMYKIFLLSYFNS